MRNKGSRENYEVQVIRRGLKIFERLADEKNGMGVVELAEVLGFSPSAAHRILRTMMREGYIKQNEFKKYELGSKLLGLVSRFLNNMDLRKEAMPYLEELGARTGETAHLVIRDGNEALCVENVECTSNMRVTLPIGGHNPLCCTAVGKVFLQDFSDRELSSLIKKERIGKRTPNTLTSFAQLKKEAEEIKKSGYAVDNEEYELGVRCIASGIRDFSGAVIAAVGISGPSARITKNKVKEFAGYVVSAARRLSSAIAGVEKR